MKAKMWRCLLAALVGILMVVVPHGAAPAWAATTNLPVRMPFTGQYPVLGCCGYPHRQTFGPQGGVIIDGSTVGGGRGRGQLGAQGVVFGTPKGTPIVAVADGTVFYAGEDPNGNGGKCVMLEHGPFDAFHLYSIYCYLDSIAVVQGAQVKAGDPIGVSGNSGAGAPQPAGGLLFAFFVLVKHNLSASWPDPGPPLAKGAIGVDDQTCSAGKWDTNINVFNSEWCVDFNGFTGPIAMAIQSWLATSVVKPVGDWVGQALFSILIQTPDLTAPSAAGLTDFFNSMEQLAFALWMGFFALAMARYVLTSLGLDNFYGAIGAL
ncbi:MAG TPA: M23 family metallopeptidase, partial [Chloroflexota bacterium]|nr:M23 family metallopeptidase [Chloroflexota bacterium]